VKHLFVEIIPDQLEADTLYISLTYNVAVHMCASGCGLEVVTPLSPVEWALTYDGHAISLYPSIGNWSLPCRSHYWIKDGEIQWAESWDRSRVEAARQRDLHDKQVEYGGLEVTVETKAKKAAPRSGFGRLLDWLGL
jgi:hypothetical protein